ncbi:hypothetical protein ACU686_21325 [Yinghuangia aomiensis]
MPVTEEMRAGAPRPTSAVCHLVRRAKDEGALRADVSDADISLLLSCLLPPPGLPKAQRTTRGGALPRGGARRAARGTAPRLLLGRALHQD